MKIEIPSSSGIFKQVNKGEIYGNIYASWNLDLLSNFGKAKISQHTKPQTIATDSSNSTTPVAITKGFPDGTLNYWGIFGRFLYKNSSVDDTWTKDATSGTPTVNPLYADVCAFEITGGSNVNCLIVADGQYLHKLQDSAWSVSFYKSGLLSGYPHPICKALNVNLLLVGNEGNIASLAIDGTWNTSKLTLPRGYQVDWIKASATTVWIGARDLFGRQGAVFTWDGVSQTTTAKYDVYADISYACAIKNETPYIVNSKGQLLRFNGAGFSEVAVFPIMNTKKYFGTTPIHRNGMEIIDGQVHILLNAFVNGTSLLERQLSGIWCYTDENGLFQRYSISKNSATNEYDYGSPQVYDVGVLQQTDKSSGSFFAGATVYADATTTQGEILRLDMVDTKKKMAYFITPWFQAQDLDEMWNSVNLVLKKLENSTDFIKVKYRFSKKYNDIATTLTGTWLTTTTFTCTLGAVDLTVGDEIEILAGNGSGVSAKVTSVENIGTQTITIDTAVPTASGTFTFRSEQWTLLDTVQDLFTVYKEIGLGLNNPTIQLKIILAGKGDSPELGKIILTSKPQVTAQ